VFLCLFLNSQGEGGPFVLSSGILYFSHLEVCTAVPAWVSCLYPLSLSLSYFLVIRFR
jgi:hypothetical protein